MEEQKKNITKEVVSKQISKKISPKTKLIILCIGALSFLLFFFPIVIITPILVYYDADDIDLSGISIGGTYSYTKISTTTTFMWPIGSDETEEIDGVSFATGEPIPYKISSGFEVRDDPFGSGEKKNHGGLDISPISSNGYGTVNIIAAKDGTVTYSTGPSSNCPSNGENDDCGGGYGNYVMIEHSDGTTTLYGHMYENSITVNTGDTVKAGQVIGTMGSSGQSTGMHLHFEVRVNGERVDPLNYISEENTRPEVKTSTYVEGTDTMQTICLTLKDAGYSDIAVAAIMGNFQRESGYDPTIANSIGASGLAQWLGDRVNNLKNTYGDDWVVLENQLEFTIYELNTTETWANDLLNDESVTSAYEMGHRFCCRFERPGLDDEEIDANCKATTRGEAAEEVLPYVQNGCK